MDIPQNLMYTKEHEWIKVEGKQATVGITDYAQGSLGDITFADLPKIGNEYKQFSQIAAVESVKAASDVYAPMSGKVVKINEDLKKAPELINKEPYGKGWFCVLEMTNPIEKSNLMNASEYGEYLKEHSK